MVIVRRKDRQLSSTHCYDRRGGLSFSRIGLDGVSPCIGKEGANVATYKGFLPSTDMHELLRVDNDEGERVS